MAQEDQELEAGAIKAALQHWRNVGVTESYRKDAGRRLVFSKKELGRLKINLYNNKNDIKFRKKLFLGP